MASVETLRGALDTSELGFTLMHEHVIIGPEGLMANYPGIWNESKAAEVRESLQKAYRLGVRTMVDHTVMGLGRNVPVLLQVAGDLPINIIVCTGLYYFQDLPGYFQHNDIDLLVDVFVKDIQEGIQGTTVRAGVVKAATEAPGLTPGVEKQVRAAARAHRMTGAVLTTHTNAGKKRGFDQQRIFKEEGVDLSRVLIGHCGETDDIDYAKQIMDQGSFAGMDRFGYEPTKGLEEWGFQPLAKRIAMVAELCKMGYAGQMILSHDAACTNYITPDHIHELILPNSTHFYLHEQVIPQLLEAGVTQTQIDLMTITNPRKIFEVNGKPY